MGAESAGKGTFEGGLGGLGDRSCGDITEKSSNPDDFDACVFNKLCFEDTLAGMLKELGCCVMDGEAVWNSAKSSSNGSDVGVGDSWLTCVCTNSECVAEGGGDNGESTGIELGLGIEGGFDKDIGG